MGLRVWVLEQVPGADSDAGKTDLMGVLISSIGSAARRLGFESLLCDPGQVT